jgi:hypothetical protein
MLKWILQTLGKSFGRLRMANKKSERALTGKNARGEVFQAHSREEEFDALPCDPKKLAEFREFGENIPAQLLQNHIENSATSRKIAELGAKTENYEVIGRLVVVLFGQISAMIFVLGSLFFAYKLVQSGETLKSIGGFFFALLTAGGVLRAFLFNSPSKQNEKDK